MNIQQHVLSAIAAAIFVFSMQNAHSQQESDLSFNVKMMHFVALYDVVFREDIESRLSRSEAVALSIFVHQQPAIQQRADAEYAEQYITMCDSNSISTGPQIANREHVLDISFHKKRAADIRQELAALSKNTRTEIMTILDNIIGQDSGGIDIVPASERIMIDDETYKAQVDAACNAYRTGGPSVLELKALEDLSNEDD